MNGQRPSPTMTGTELIQRCNTLVLRLKDSSASSRNSEVRRLVNDAQERVRARFDQLVREYISFDNKAIRPDLARALEEAENREKFLEAFVLKLYHRANQIEEENATRLLDNDERERLYTKTWHENNRDNYHAHNRHPSGNHHPDYQHPPGNHHPDYQHPPVNRHSDYQHPSSPHHPEHHHHHHPPSHHHPDYRHPDYHNTSGYDNTHNHYPPGYGN